MSSNGTISASFISSVLCIHNFVSATAISFSCSSCSVKYCTGSLFKFFKDRFFSDFSFLSFNSSLCITRKCNILQVMGTCIRAALQIPDTITTLIHSSEIAVERKCRKAKLKSPLKFIETRSMHSNGLKTHCPAKILHRGGHFSGACKAKNGS